MNNPELEAIGYINYRKRITTEKYNEAVYEKIINHRDAILEKYADSDNKEVGMAVGMYYAAGVFFPTDYDGVAVDADDVYAAAYNVCYSKGVWKTHGEKYAFWILLTNDPYVPVLPMICIQHYNPLELLIKKEKNELKPLIEDMCKNLKYPICHMKELEKMVNNEYSVRGNAKKPFVLEQISDALNENGLFDINSISCEAGGGTVKLFERFGYKLNPEN